MNERHKSTWKTKFEKYYGDRLNFGINFCYEKFSPEWTECYLIIHFGKYYLMVGKF